MEEEVDFVVVQPRAAGNTMVTIPKEIVDSLNIKGRRKVKVFLDREKRRVIYQF